MSRTLDLRKKKTSVWAIAIVEGVLFVACLAVFMALFVAAAVIIHS